LHQDSWSLSLFSVPITIYLRLGNLERKEIYFLQVIQAEKLKSMVLKSAFHLVRAILPNYNMAKGVTW
jgi:hypothetical protein